MEEKTHLPYIVCRMFNIEEYLKKYFFYIKGALSNLVSLSLEKKLLR